MSVRVSNARDPEREAVIAALVGAGAPGVQEAGDALLTFVPADVDVTALCVALGRASRSASVDCAPATEQASSPWAIQVGIQRLGALVVTPPWFAAEAGDPARTIVIEPAMAFGTGEHPTTRGVLRLMQGVVRDGDVVADLGAGSAVLSIAAVKLGAARAAAIELDGDAIANAEANVLANGVGGRVVVLHGDASVLLPLVAPVRVIVANILSGVILELLPAMRGALADGGRAIASGMLEAERPAMLREFEGAGWRVEAEDDEGGWWSSVIAPR